MRIGCPVFIRCRAGLISALAVAMMWPGGSVVVDQVGGLWPVIRLETTDELHRSTVEGVDVLVVVAYCEEGELTILILSGSVRPGLISTRIDPRQCPGIRPPESSGNPREAVPADRLLPPGSQPLAAQQCHCLAQYFAECIVVEQPPFSLLKADTDQSHGQRVTGEHGYPAGVVADQIYEASPDLDRCVSIVGQGQNAAGIFAPCAHEVGDAMYQHSRLAGAGTGEHQHVRLLPIIRDDTLLNGDFSDFRRWLATIRAWSPAQSPCPDLAANDEGNPPDSG